MSSMERNTTDKNKIAITNSGWNPLTHHDVSIDSVPNSAKVRTKANGSNVSHIIVNRTAYRVYPVAYINAKVVTMNKKKRET